MQRPRGDHGTNARVFADGERAVLMAILGPRNGLDFAADCFGIYSATSVVECVELSHLCGYLGVIVDDVDQMLEYSGCFIAHTYLIY